MTRKKYLLGALVLVLAVALGVAGRLGQGSHTITLRASGGTSLDVSYVAGDRNSQDAAAASPWLASYQFTGSVPTVTMTVQNGGGVSVSCSITEDGHVVASNTSYGAYAVVQCSA
jgi:hypothetical protein